MSDIFIPLEAIKPSGKTPITLLDKNGVKVILHFADSLRPDILVTVVTIMSTNANEIKNIKFLAAVPKVSSF